MSDGKTLDRLILTDFLLAVASLSVAAASSPRPPAGFTFVLWILVCVATVGAWIGLLSRLRPARALYAASWLGYLALVAIRGGGTGASLDALLDLGTGLVGGMVLALVYFSDLRTQFRGLGEADVERLLAR